MVIKINYTSSDVYVSTSVSPVYVVVNYSGVSTGGGVWGQITGTLSNQTDLQNALDAKFDDPTGTTSQYLRGDGSLATFPTIPSGTVTSVGLTMPSAFSVANSPVTSSGTLAVTGAGTASQYVRGDGQLATLPSGAGGGSSVNYYLNGSINQGTIGGSVYYEMNRIPVIGTGTDFTRTNLQGDGLIAQFITDANDPNRLEIPAGAWNFEMYFNVSSAGGSPAFYLELLKYDGTTFTSIANGSTNPETITGGTAVDLYLSSLAVPQTTLLATDRLAIRVYVITSGRNITLHTEDNNLCEIITTFAGGVASLNGLTANTQYFATGTSGTDFAISSATDTHTFNLPTASATNRGALSSADWSTFSGKVGGSGATGQVAYWNGTNSQTGSSRFTFGTSPSVTIQGSAATSSTTALLIQNSTPSDLFRILDNGVTSFGVNITSGNKFIVGPENTYGTFVISSSSSGVSIYGDPLGGWFTGYRFRGSAGTLRGGLFVNGTTDSVNYYTLGPSLTNGLTVNDTTGNISIGSTTDSGQRLQVQGDAFIKGSGATSATNALLVQNSGGTTTLTLNNAGNLGLGVVPSAWASPTYRAFQIGSTAALFSASGQVLLDSNSYVNSSFLDIYTSTGVATRYQQVSGQHRWFNAPSGTAGNAISFTQAMTLTGGGNLLVGTTVDSGQKFQVNGNGLFTGSGNTLIKVESTASFPLYQLTKGGGLSWNIENGRTSNTFGIYQSGGTGGGTTYLAIAEGGNVLINTVSDSGFRLDVSGTARVQGAATFSSSVTATNYLMNRGGGQWNIIPSSGANYLYFQENTGNKDIMTLDGVNQRVGIGTTSPSYKLVVRGESSTHQKLAITRVASDVAALFLGSNSSEQGMIAANNADLLFGTDISNTFTERLRITSGGNLLVGTTTDAGFRLDVNGTARVSGNLTLGGSYRVLYFGASSNSYIVGENNDGLYFSGKKFEFSDTTTKYGRYQRVSGITSFLIGEDGAGRAAAASSILELFSSTQGFLPPRMTNAQRTAISSPAVGLMVYQTDSTEGTYEYISSGWRIINGGGGGGSVDELQVSLICQVFG